MSDTQKETLSRADAGLLFVGLQSFPPLVWGWSVGRRAGWSKGPQLLGSLSRSRLGLVQPVRQRTACGWETKADKAFCLDCRVFVSSQEAEEEASHLGSSLPLLSNHGPSAYLPVDKGICLTPSLSPLCLIYVVLGTEPRVSGLLDQHPTNWSTSYSIPHPTSQDLASRQTPV